MNLDISQAVTRARLRTGDASITTRPRAGKFQIVSVVHRGVPRVQTMSDWMELGQVIATLNAMQGEEETA